MKYQKYISKIKIIFILLLLALIFTYSFLILSSSPKVYAQELTPDPAATQSSVDYQLAYPGLLPDSPLFFIRAARDRIMSFLISDPLKKSEFDLLQADKRIAASFLLIQKGHDKLSLSESTFSKGENYFEDAINRANDARSQGSDVSEIAKNLTDANLKHQEVLTDIEKKLNKKDQSKFNPERVRLMEFKKRVKSLVKQK